MGTRVGIAHLLGNLGHVLHHQGEDVRAATCYAESLTLFRELGDQARVAFGLTGLAEVAGKSGQIEQAARLFGAAEVMLQKSGASRYPVDHAEYQRNVAFMRAAIDATAFTAAWEAGRALPLDQAIAEALRIADATIAAASGAPM
jgi:hypothetical protein